MKKRIWGKGSKNLTRPNQFILRRWVEFFIALGMIPAILTTIPVGAAERIYFTYGPLGLSVGVDSLEVFAKEGRINRELDFYLRGMSEEGKAQFRKALLQRYYISSVQLYRFLRTPIGENLLAQIGNLINIQGGRNGKYGLRGALVQAAADPEGLTLLNLMRKFPTNIQLNTEGIFNLVGLFKTLVTATDVIVTQIDELTAIAAAAQAPVDFSALSDIRHPGEFNFDKQTLTLKDRNRKRQFLVDLYKPQRWRSGKTPVVVISHGFGTGPKNFEKRAKHLASYGYLVAVPQHLGSDYAHIQAMLTGYSREVFKLNEFIDRPLDVIYVLDELERRNQSEFQGRLNLQKVGVMGHSFGGYTALALAGAEIDFEQLEANCNFLFKKLNPSLLLQCRALELPQQDYNFRDRRVKAVMATNPVNSAIFGPKGLSRIQIPVFMVAGSQDPVTPAVLEQIRSFTWLTGSDKYLALEKGNTHFDISELDAETLELLESLPKLTLPKTDLFSGYARAMSLAFFQVYIANNAEYSPYLRSSYAEYISEEPFNLYLLDSSSVDQLTEALDLLKPDN